ncbi:PD-(D/E)XK nuclease family protein [Fredinandcohnia humi]
MIALISHLQDVCKTHFLQEKILIVDSYMIGEQILFHLADKGGHAVNLKIKTVRELAMEAVAERQRDVIQDAQGSHFMYSLLNTLRNTTSLRYFNDVEITPALSYSMYQTVKQLRLAGYKSWSLPQSHFVSDEKGADMIEILYSYEQLLQDYQVIDDADLYELALNKSSQSNSVYILQSYLTLSYLQEKFLKALLPTEYIKLPLAKVNGITLPNRTELSSVRFAEETPLSFLYDTDRSSGRVTTLSLFSAKTKEAELKKVLQIIKQKGITFDEAVIFYTAGSEYITTMYHLSEKMNVPVTFGDGIPVSFTRPGKLVAGTIRWMKESYSIQAFLKLLQENVMNLEEDAPSKARWASLLRQANIGWNPERYIALLQAQIEETEEKAKSEANKERSTYFEKLNHEYTWLLKWFTSVFKYMPTIQPDGTLNYASQLLAIRYLLTTYGKVTSGYDQAAKEAILEQIEIILPYANEGVTSSEGFLKLEEDLLTIHVGQSRPRPGNLHMTTYKNGFYINREHLFVIGLDNQRFPGNAQEDPLLLDIEREKLGNRLPLKKEKTKRDLYLMLQFFASSATKQLTVSYCKFSINENRAITPSYLFLQCYRLQSGNHTADFNTLHKEVPLIDGSITVEQADWWSKKVMAPLHQVLDEKLLAYYSNIESGLGAEEMRKTGSFTSYEGKIESDTSLFDPRRNPDITISAGKLEKIAACPYAYFLENILRIKVIEEVTYDPSKWLDPATRGTLLHEIFEVFYKTIQAKGEKPSYQKHINEILRITYQRLEELKMILPPPNQRVADMESEEIIESCETFLRIEEENSQLGEPLYFEYSFGEDSPATIELPTGMINVRGIIDRVDRLPDGSFHIIDYKTGSSWGYETKHFFKGGRQLQHLLYTLAIESHLGVEEGRVKKSTYFFPTRKGIGKRFEREQDETTRANGKDILDKLLTIVEHGHFTMTDDEKDCKFCDYKSICRRSTYDKEMIEVKHQDPSAQGIKSFLGVRAYD